MSTVTNIQKTQYSPSISGAADSFTARLLPSIDPATAIDTGQFAPSVAGVTGAQKAAQQMAATQAGLGALQFDPSDSDGTDGTAISARIAAVAEGTFSASNNSTRLEFQLGQSEAASTDTAFHKVVQEHGQCACDRGG